MYSLFLLLFKPSYWQMLFSASTWSSAGHSLRRVHKDHRARKHLGRLALFCLIPVLCLAYLAWLAGSGAIFMLPFIAPILWMIHRNHHRNDPAALSISAKPAPIHRELTTEERQQFRTWFANLTLVYAILIDRGGSEAFLKNKVLPEGVEVISRRTHIDLLKSRNLWDCISPADRQAMMMPDGSWDWRHIHTVTEGFESLRLLRWILRLDFYLPAVGQQLRYNFNHANELVRAPDRIFEGNDLADLSMLETARDVAREYLIRCYAEEVSRGTIVPEKDDTAEWARNLASSLEGKQSADLVLEGKLVSESEESILRQATQLSRTRMDYLDWVISLLNNPLPPELRITCFQPDAFETPAESAQQSVP